MRLLASRGFSPRLLATFSNGHATEAAQGVRLNYDLCIDPSVYPVVAATIGNMHRQMNDQVFTNLRNLLNRKYTNNAKAGRLSVACANASHKAVTTVRYTSNYHDSFDLRSLFTVAFKFFIGVTTVLAIGKFHFLFQGINFYQGSGFVIIGCYITKNLFFKPIRKA